MDVKEINKGKINLKFKSAIPVIAAVARCVIGFILARGLIFAEYAPFGIAWCAASGGIGTVGAILGYASILYKANGLKYIAICILIYTAGYIFRDTTIIKKRAFMPITTLICTASIGFVFVLGGMNPWRDAMFFLTEVALSTASAYFYALSLKGKNERQRRVGLFLLAATAILPLHSVSIFSLSVGKVLSGLLILIMGYYGGVGAGSATGITLSFAMGGALSPIYGMCGLVAPLFRTRGVLIYIATFLAVGITATLWTTMNITMAFIGESTMASALFLTIMNFYGVKLEKVFSTKAEVQDYERLKKYLSRRIKRTSEAFYELSYIFGGKREQDEKSFAPVFDAPLQKVCKKCVLANNCWEREFIKNKEAIEVAINALEGKSKLETRDFPVHFAARCIKIDEFIDVANHELAKVLYRKKCRAEIEENRRFIKKQYGEMGRIIAGLNDELALTIDERYEVKISDFFESNEITAYPTVYRDLKNHIHIEVEGERLERLCCEEFAEDLSDYLGFKVTVPIRTGDERIVLRQKETLKVSFGASFNKKRGNTISGDAGSYYRTEEGNLALILADGMGSGNDAAIISSNTIKLVERFNRAKIDMALALSVINSALTVNGESESAFTTIDFMELNLYNGKASIWKLGSAPTYICHKGRVRTINCTTLPAGVPAPKKNNAERNDVQIYPEDFLVFITDGVIETEDDGWISDLIANYKGKSARELTGEIVAAASAKYEGGDDMTVITVYVDKNI